MLLWWRAAAAPLRVHPPHPRPPAAEALRAGKWVLFDELNLAPPAVLDAIAPLLARRGGSSSVATSFTVPGSNEEVAVTTTRFFATMNPTSVGGNRSRLPRSVDALFVKVTLTAYTGEELLAIMLTLFNDTLERSEQPGAVPGGARTGQWNFITADQLERLLRLQEELADLVAKRAIGRSGGPFEFNLRDLVKFRDVLAANANCLRSHFKFLVSSAANASDRDVRLFVIRTIAELVYALRFQSAAERKIVHDLICDTRFFALPKGAKDLASLVSPTVDMSVPGYLRVGSVYMPVKEDGGGGAA